jgi:CheY-like chemotaxis protein
MTVKILVAEDDLAMVELFRLMLSDFELIEAYNGEEAVRKYNETNPDIVLMDIMMPVMDGIDATRLILKDSPDAKIIAVTAFARSKGKNMLEAGAVDILEKPFTKKKLLELLGKYITIRDKSQCTRE